MKTIKLFLILALTLSFSFAATSCRPKHAKQIVNIVDDKIDDLSRNGGIKIKKNPIKQCKSCSGTGQVYYQGYWYQCSKCHGTGKVVFN